MQLPRGNKGVIMYLFLVLKTQPLGGGGWQRVGALDRNPQRRLDDHAAGWRPVVVALMVRWSVLFGVALLLFLLRRLRQLEQYVRDMRTIALRRTKSGALSDDEDEPELRIFLVRHGESLGIDTTISPGIAQ